MNFLGHANTWYHRGLRDIQQYGQEVTTRGRKTWEVLHAVTALPHPRKRVLTIPWRRANPFFQALEPVWILAGRSDAEWICRYNRQLRKFLDAPDAEHFHGAYGERIRRWGNSDWLSWSNAVQDQVAAVVEQLQRESDSRRAVIVLRNPEYDNPWIETNDMPCMAGETVLWSPEGDLPIEQVADKFAQGEVDRWPVYAADVETLGLRLAWATRVWKTSIKPVVRLVFEDGSNLRLTADHVLYVKRRIKILGDPPKVTRRQVQPCRAGDLRPGDRILATQRWYGPKGHEWHKRQLDANTSYRNRIGTHQEYAELLWGMIPDGHDVHHQNGVETDNRAANLQVLDHGSHAAIKMGGDLNPMRRLSAEQHRARGAKHSISLRKRWADHLFTVSCQCLRCRACSQDNHLVIAVEPAGEAAVYDFTVPGAHTALVGTGVVAHNCNLACTYQLRDGRLHAATFNRSNDFNLGLSYTNIVQFTTIQEFLAQALGADDVGVYTHFSSSLHVYEDDAVLSGLMLSDQVDPFDVYDYVQPVRMSFTSGLQTGDQIIQQVVGLTSFQEAQALPCDYWRSVALMKVAWEGLYAGSRGWARSLPVCLEEVLSVLGFMPALDWQIACLEYVHRWAIKRDLREQFVDLIHWYYYPQQARIRDFILHDTRVMA